jgi:hypothetical protein
LKCDVGCIFAYSECRKASIKIEAFHRILYKLVTKEIFESVVYTNFTIPALSGGYCPFDVWHYTYAYECRKYKNLKFRVFADNFATKL